MKIKYWIQIIALSVPFLLTAQVNDSTFYKRRSLHNNTPKVVNKDPFSKKCVGLEFNPFRLFFLDQGLTLSGSLSFFGINRHAEVAFPVYYQSKDKSTDLSAFTFDCHYRYFLGKHQNGLYLSAFTRYTYLNGTLGKDQIPENPTALQISNFKQNTELKFGAGLGIGYRVFTNSGFYWGTSLNIGEYLLGKSDRFYGAFRELDDDNKYIIDWEILKMGWAF